METVQQDAFAMKELESRYFSEQGISELYEDRPDPVAPSDEREREFRLMAEQAIRASLELADTMEAA